MAKTKITKPTALSVFERMALIRTAVLATIADTEKLRRAVKAPKPPEWDSATDLCNQLDEALTYLDEAGSLLRPLRGHHVDQYPAGRARQVTGVSHE